MHLVSFGNYLLSIIGHFKWSDHLLSEIQDVIYSNFNDINSAFAYFAKKANGEKEPSNLYEFSLSYQDFKKSLESLLPKRFSSNELEPLWNKISQGNSVLTYTAFSGFLNANKFQKAEKILQK